MADVIEAGEKGRREQEAQHQAALKARDAEHNRELNELRVQLAAQPPHRQARTSPDGTPAAASGPTSEGRGGSPPAAADLGSARVAQLERELALA